MFTRTGWVLLLGCVAGALGAPAGFAATGTVEKIEFRYEMVVIDGKPYRFDKQTGTAEPVNLLKSNKNERPAPKSIRTEVFNSGPIDKPESNNAPEIIDLGDGPPEPGSVTTTKVPQSISEKQRRVAREDVDSYTRNLGIMQLVEVAGDDITGTLAVTNKGPRRLLALELTLFVPTSGEKVIKHRFLMGNREDQMHPPQPSKSEERKPDPVFIKVNVPSPVGIKGKINTRVTYVKFAD